MAQNNRLSSADLLTLQVLKREMEDPLINENYKWELLERIEYLNADDKERAENWHGYVRVVQEMTKRS